MEWLHKGKGRIYLHCRHNRVRYPSLTSNSSKCTSLPHHSPDNLSRDLPLLPFLRLRCNLPMLDQWALHILLSNPWHHQQVGNSHSSHLWAPHHRPERRHLQLLRVQSREPYQLPDLPNRRFQYIPCNHRREPPLLQQFRWEMLRCNPL